MRNNFDSVYSVSVVSPHPRVCFLRSVGLKKCIASIRYSKFAPLLFEVQ